MATRIRLSRRGRKKLAIYDIVIADSRSPRDGRIIEKIGNYNPNTNPATINIDEDKALSWLMKGAQPSETVRAILSYKGLLLKKHLQVGVLKGALKQDEADKKLEKWLKEKEEKINKKISSLEESEKDAEKKRIDNEKAYNKKRAEEAKKKLEEKLAKEAEEVKEEAPAEEPKKEEAPAEEPKKEEAPAEEAKEEPKKEEEKGENNKN